MSNFATDILGGVKFFAKNKALFRDGNTASASSNDTAAKLMLDISKYTRWESLASNDLTTEAITINFSSAKTLDRLIFTEHNLKAFTITYNSGTEFTNVNNLDGDIVGGIAETDYNLDTAYYRFDSVSVSSIVISATTAQVVDAQKYITQFIATAELGTLAGFPRIQNVQHNRNIKGSKALSGKNVIQKGYETTTFRINFKTYPVQLDIDLVEDLHESEDSFLGDFIEDQSVDSPVDNASHNSLATEIVQALETLTEREEAVLRLRYGLDDGQPRKLEEVGNRFGITRERVRQIETKAIRKLRHPLRAQRLKGFLDGLSV